MAVLTNAHPNQSDVRSVQDGYRIRARAVPGGFDAVILCDRVSGGKLVEDLSCTTSAVDVRYWDRTGPFACDFEAKPATDCK